MKFITCAANKEPEKHFSIDMVYIIYEAMHTQ